MRKNKQKIVIWDIETSLGEMASFSLYPNMISHKHILRDPGVLLCVCWKELGKKKVHALSSDGKDDKQLCKDFRKELEDVDILIAHNGDKFDLKKLNARFMIHGIEPLPPIRTVDTLKEIKKVSSFTSHRLDYLGGLLVKDHKIETTPGLWIDILRGSKKAIKEMVRYCKQDVILLEKLYLYTRRYYKSHPNIATEDQQCPTCGSFNVRKNGIRVTLGGVRHQRWRCKDCGSSAFSRKSKKKKPNLKK